jgi:5-methylcytosine-specific restriction endonuclease McrA
MVGQVVECANPECGISFAKKRSNHYCCSAKCRRAVRGSAWRWVREAVLIRDQDTCQTCEATDCPLDAHHKTPLCYGGTNDLDNLVSLCKPCHHKEHRTWKWIANGKEEAA